MIDIIGLTVVLTTHCNAACRHCGIDDEQTDGDVIETEEVKECLRAAKENSSIRAVSITGGEPLLFPDRVISIFTYARQLGLYGELVSNSLWAASYGEADTLLRTLASVNVTKYVTSFDTYHLEYIPAVNVENAVKAAVNNGMEVVIKTVSTDDRLTDEDYSEMLFGSRTIRAHIRFIIFPPVAAGKGKTLVHTNTHNRQNLHSGLEGSCNSIIKFPSITPSGIMYPCCGFGSKERAVGFFREEDMSILLHTMRHNLLFNMISHRGPAAICVQALGEKVKERWKEIQSPCDICNLIFCDPEITEAVTSLLHSNYQKLTHL